MNKQKQKITKPKPAGSRRVMWGMAGLFLAAGLAAMGYWAWHQYYHAVDPGRLAGQWVRPDGGYVLQISDTGPDGKLKAEYFNPRPINVARAEWMEEEGILGIFVELRDANYPGSTYKLAYDTEKDLLKGIYFQAVMQQQFEVGFERMK